MNNSSRMSRPVVVSGPSGCGKSTLLTRLMSKDQFRDKFMFSVSHTTRSPRPGEVDGVAYHFTTKEKFHSMVSEGLFLESAEFSGNCYGTSKKAVTDIASKPGNPVCLLDLEMNGVKQLKALDAQGKGLNCYYIFINVPSIEILESRLRGRGTETEESLQKRLDRARQDATFGTTPGNFDVIIVNDDLDTAYEKFETAMLIANPHLKPLEHNILGDV